MKQQFFYIFLLVFIPNMMLGMKDELDLEWEKQEKKKNQFEEIGWRQDERKKEADKKIIESITDLFESVVERDTIYETAAIIFTNVGRVVLKKHKEIEKQAKLCQDIVDVELMVTTESFFLELKKKTIKLQRINPVLASNRKIVTGLLWTITVANPPACAGIILCSPIIYLAASQPFIIQKLKTITRLYDQCTKKPEKNNEQNFDDLMILLNLIRESPKNIDIFEVFEKEDIEMINTIKLDEIYQAKYEIYKNILINFDYEQRLYDYYNTWFSRRTASRFSFVAICTLLAWLAAKKINPKITNKTYRSYNNWYEDYKRKTVRSLLHGIAWLLQKIDYEEDINDLKKKNHNQ